MFLFFQFPECNTNWYLNQYHRKLRKFTIWFDESTQKHLGGWQKVSQFTTFGCVLLSYEDCHVFIYFFSFSFRFVAICCGTSTHKGKAATCTRQLRQTNVHRLEIVRCWGFGGEVGPIFLIQQKLPRRALSTGTSLALGRMLGTGASGWGSCFFRTSALICK